MLPELLEFLKEDIGDRDITTDAVVPEDLEAGTTPLGAGYSAVSAGLQEFWKGLQKKAGFSDSSGANL